MIVDSSALIAILFDEPDSQQYLDALLSAQRVRISAATAVESAIVAMRRAGVEAEAELELLIVRCGADIIPVSQDQVPIAKNAFLTCGKGRHDAALNFGDCFSYALAKSYMEPLLYKGNDFAQTDIVSALA
jgi:ribonuclease VapC